MKCPSYLNILETFFRDIETTNSNFINLDSEAKFIWLLSNEDTHIITQLSKFINTIIDNKHAQV